MPNFYTNVAVGSNEILYRGVTESGQHVQVQLPYKPRLYTLTDTLGGKWRTLDGKRLTERRFPSIVDARMFAGKHKFNEDMPVYGMQKYQYAFISDLYPEDIQYDASRVRVGYIDIEVDSSIGFPRVDDADNEITAITYRIDDIYYVFGTVDYKVHRDDIKILYHRCVDEGELILKFLEVWETAYPDVISGWFSSGFDIPYLINRITNVYGRECAERISPWGMIRQRTTDEEDDNRIQYDITGISHLDYLDLYKKSWNPNASQENHRLETIGRVELGRGKLDWRALGYNSLDAFYRKDPQKYIEYNIQDVELVYDINGKCQFIELAMVLAYMTKVNIEDILFQGRMWDSIIYNYLKRDKIAIPPVKPGEKHSKYEGGYVKPIEPGWYDHVVSFDFTSLYPHIMMGWNISPETLMTPEKLAANEKLSEWMLQNRKDINVNNLLTKSVNTDILKECDAILTPNKQLFMRGVHGILARIMEDMFESRKAYKKLQIQKQKELQHASEDKKHELEDLIGRYKSMQLALKVVLNSAYGSMGSPYFRYFDTRIAEAITMIGQLSIRWVETKLNVFINKRLGTTDVDYILGEDTDSLYVSVTAFEGIKGLKGHELADFMDNLCEKELGPKITSICAELVSYTNARANKLHMKRESLIEKGIWMAKKNYIVSVLDNEGVRYDEPDVKIMGWIGIKSVTPKICRDKLRECVDTILYGTIDKLRTQVADFKAVFMQQPLPVVAAPQGIKEKMGNYVDKNTMYIKGTPQNAKAALIYNWYLKHFNTGTKYEQIVPNSNMKIVPLKEPNPIHQEVIGFVDVLPTEFGLDNYVDYEALFEKVFISPLEKVLSKINWQLTKTTSLGKFMRKKVTV